MENRKDEGLKSLGKKTTYAMDYAPEVLETFTNRHPEPKEKIASDKSVAPEDIEKAIAYLQG